jgi:hypothetical protein
MSKDEATPKQCQATRKDGSPCRAPAVADGLCFAHRGGEAAAAARSRGGHGRSKVARAAKRMPERLRPAADLIAQALDETYSGKLEPRQASAMAALAGALVKLVTVGEVEERLAQLEARLGAAS